MAYLNVGSKTKKKEPVLSDGVRLVLQNYTRVSQYHKRNVLAAVENYRMYFGKNPELGMGQYKPEAVQRLMKQGRHLVQYNFTLPLIDTLAASLMQSKLNPDFVPVNDEISSLTEALNKATYSDRELMNWDAAMFELVTGGLLHEGVVKMGISDKWSKLGNISMEAMLPGSTFSDPAWRTQMSSDCEHVWHDGWYNAEQLMQIFGKKSAEIQAAARRVKHDGVEYGENMGVVPYRGDLNNVWGSLYKVIEQYDVTEVKGKALFLLQPSGQVRIQVKDELDAPAWLNANYPDWDPLDIFEDEEKNKICTVKIICPSLMFEDYLENGKTELQIQATPFKFWSASRLAGEPRGLIESIKDAQTYINYWSGLLTHKIQIEGGGGAQFTDPEMFLNYAEYERFCNHRNNGAENFRLKPGYLEKNVTPSRPVIASQFPTEAYRNLEFIIDKVLPQISKVTPALSGRSEGANESGYLYRQKKAQSDLQAWTIHQGFRNFWNDWYESYLMAAPNVYGNESVERQFTLDKGRQKLKVNEVLDLGDGRYGIRNDMNKLREIRHKVIITEKPDSPTQKAANIMLYADMVRSISQFPQKATTAGVIMGLLFDNVDDIPESDKTVLQKVNSLETELEVQKLETQILMQQAAKIQAEQQLKNIQNPPPPPPPPPPTDPNEVARQAAMATGGKVTLNFTADAKKMIQAGPVPPSVSGVEQAPAAGQLPESLPLESTPQGPPDVGPGNVPQGIGG